MRYFLFSVFFNFFILNCDAQVIDVRVFANKSLTSIIVSPFSGQYSLWVDGILLDKSVQASLYQFNFSDNSIEVKTFEKSLGIYKKISFVGEGINNTLKVKTIANDKLIKTYDDGLEISILNQSLKIINKVDLENYIGGVVESESGSKSTAEYYKVQSVLCRTYTLSHLRRHEADGYHLCDQVHCQAYKGKSNVATILNAVLNAKGLVVVDADLNLITAAYHSNCGGQTINSEDVWSLPTSYLKSIKDTFCLLQPHANWQKKIPIEDWVSYLSLKHKYPIADTASYNNALNYNLQTQNNREIFFIDKDLKIPLRTIREDWQLKSTYFTIEQKNDIVVFNGKGYGHGVGLCQEGAMRMAKLGYDYKDIIHHYYKDVHIVDLSVLDFFRQE